MHRIRSTIKLPPYREIQFRRRGSGIRLTGGSDTIKLVFGGWKEGGATLTCRDAAGVIANVEEGEANFHNFHTRSETSRGIRICDILASNF
ncbi:hypothetical protein Trydic_g19683 [Trypoxylus dichotomus]